MDNVDNDKESKSRITAGLLGIFLGLFGAHNFYLGYIKKAVIQIYLNLSCPMFFFLAVHFGFSAHAGANTILASLVMPTLVLGILMTLVACIWWVASVVMILIGKIKDTQGKSLQ